MKSLKLNDNPWTCNCSMEWLVNVNYRWLVNAIVSDQKMVCREPRMMHGREFPMDTHELQKDAFTCKVCWTQHFRRGVASNHLQSNVIVVTAQILIWAVITKNVNRSVYLQLYNGLKWSSQCLKPIFVMSYLNVYIVLRQYGNVIKIAC